MCCPTWRAKPVTHVQHQYTAGNCPYPTQKSAGTCCHQFHTKRGHLHLGIAKHLLQHQTWHNILLSSLTSSCTPQTTAAQDLIEQMANSCHMAYTSCQILAHSGVLGSLIIPFQTETHQLQASGNCFDLTREPRNPWVCRAPS